MKTPIDTLIRQIGQHPWIGALALVLLAACVIALIARSSKDRTPVTRPFRVRPRPLLTDNEREFAERMTIALEPRYRVLIQVSMGALIDPDLTADELAEDRSAWIAVRSRFAQKVVDFVVATPEFEPLVLVELDDQTHDPVQDAARDAITHAAGYPTLRYESRHKPGPGQISDDVEEAIRSLDADWLPRLSRLRTYPPSRATRS